jgi:hypothetical protein
MVSRSKGVRCKAKCTADLHPTNASMENNNCPVFKIVDSVKSSWVATI